MRKQILAAAGLATSALLLAACGSSPAPSAAAAPPAAYARAISALTAHCTQDAAQLDAMVRATRSIEVKAGVTDESLTSLARHLATVTAAYGKHRVSCVDPFAAYATMRTSG